MSRHPSTPIKDVKVIAQKKQILVICTPSDEDLPPIGLKLSHPLAMKLRYELDNGIQTDLNI